MNTKALMVWVVFIVLLIAVLMMIPQTRGFTSNVVGKVPMVGTYVQKIPTLSKPF